MAEPPARAALDQLVHIVADSAHRDLRELQRSLARAGGGAADDDRVRRDRLLAFARLQQARFTRLLAVVRWAEDLGHGAVLTQADAALRQLGELQGHTNLTHDRLYFMQGKLYQARLRLFDVATAADVLATGAYPHLPEGIRFVGGQPPAPAPEEVSSLRWLEGALHARLLSVALPAALSEARVEEGMLLLRVDGEFSAALTLLSPAPDAPFELVQLRLLVGGVSDLTPAQHQYLVRMLRHVLRSTDDEPLEAMVRVARSFCARLRLALLRAQAEALPPSEARLSPSPDPSGEDGVTVSYWPGVSAAELAQGEDKFALTLSLRPTAGDVTATLHPPCPQAPPAVRNRDVQELLDAAARQHAALRLAWLAGCVRSQLHGSVRAEPGADGLALHWARGQRLVVGVDLRSGAFTVADAAADAHELALLAQALASSVEHFGLALRAYVARMVVTAVADQARAALRLRPLRRVLVAGVQMQHQHRPHRHSHHHHHRHKHRHTHGPGTGTGTPTAAPGTPLGAVAATPAATAAVAASAVAPDRPLLSAAVLFFLLADARSDDGGHRFYLVLELGGDAPQFSLLVSRPSAGTSHILDEFVSLSASSASSASTADDGRPAKRSRVAAEEEDGGGGGGGEQDPAQIVEALGDAMRLVARPLMRRRLLRAVAHWGVPVEQGASADELLLPDVPHVGSATLTVVGDGSLVEVRVRPSLDLAPSGAAFAPDALQAPWSYDGGGGGELVARLDSVSDVRAALTDSLPGVARLLRAALADDSSGVALVRCHALELVLGVGGTEFTVRPTGRHQFTVTSPGAHPLLPHIEAALTAQHNYAALCAALRGTTLALAKLAELPVGAVRVAPVGPTACHLRSAKGTLRVAFSATGGATMVNASGKSVAVGTPGEVLAQVRKLLV